MQPNGWCWGFGLLRCGGVGRGPRVGVAGLVWVEDEGVRNELVTVSV
ncbi:hypothetical protein JOF34_001839 [Microbacterium amylolyticum]|uniref:Uncharacterized protein n=1 Tax=Microbacterium amylolyticum TaxID=936337 RepID=A0ABS4ZJP3_9MICO|nr:hypothetical protein [Microbacterium amylolyticum]